ATPCWIWLGSEPRDKQTVFFRKEVQVKGNVTGARLYGTCDNEMTVFLDGKQVLSSDDWTTPAFKDVTDVFRADKGKGDGRHVLPVRAHNTDGPAGLLLKLEVETRNRQTTTVVTDETWRAAAKPADGWLDRGFDDKGWAAATVVGKLGDQPWGSITTAALT